MSWKFGGLVMQKDFSKKLEGFFETLGRTQKFSGTILSFRESLGIKGNQSAAGSIEQNTILLNEFLPYDCSFTPGIESGFDKKLANVSKEGLILVFFLDGTSGTYGFSVFENGERIRRWAATEEDILCNEGEYLDVELPFIAGMENTGEYACGEEARMIGVFENYIQADFSMLIKNEDLKFYVFA
jgi:hypothetical protein